MALEGLFTSNVIIKAIAYERMTVLLKEPESMKVMYFSERTYKNLPVQQQGCAIDALILSHQRATEVF